MAVCLPVYPLMLCVSILYAGFAGLILPLPYAWNAGLPKYVVKDESASHLVVALISLFLFFSAFSSAVNFKTFFFFGLSVSSCYMTTCFTFPFVDTGRELFYFCCCLVSSGNIISLLLYFGVIVYEP